MGVYKLTLPGSSVSQELSGLGSKKTIGAGFRSAFMGRRFQSGDHYVRASASSSLEAPEMEHFAAISEDEEMRSNDESVFTSASSSGTSTRTSNTISDDDSMLLMEFAGSTAGIKSTCSGAPARHSTACCSDLAFRREIRKRVVQVEPAVDELGGLQLQPHRCSTSNFTLGSSFRRELDKDCIESLALWEETAADHKPQPAAADRAVQSNCSAAAHSWHAGDTAAAAAAAAPTSIMSRSSARSRGLDAILRKKKSSFLNSFFSGLSFSSSRKSRKSLG